MRPPQFLNKTARKYWRKYARKTTDHDRLALLCQAFANHEGAARAIEKDGMSYAGPSGRLIPHPLLGTMNSTANTILRLLKALGLDDPELEQEDELEGKV